MTNKKVRVRFAPSPTGPLHVGGLRTALFNYLFAKKLGGDFILRIEDTDRKREVAGADKYIASSLNWCGLVPDEGPSFGGELGPYRQSERFTLYKEHINLLISLGKAYYAFDSEEDLNRYRKDHTEKGETFIYNWHNRLKLKNSLVMSDDEVRKRINKGEGHVVRFFSPENQDVKTDDLIRGSSSIDSSLLDDKILIKADGTPTYHFANVVDDHMMKITHVIRGEEWLPSLALHTLLYDSFGWKKPVFAHLPLILNPSGKGKLSKRSGEKNGFPVFPLKWEGESSFKGFRESGILPGGVINYIATLGWSPREGKEVLDLSEMVEMFDLKKVVSAGANFDYEKLKWYNHKHIQRTSNDSLASLLAQISPALVSINSLKLSAAISLVKERANTIYDLEDLIEYLFIAPSSYNEKNLKRLDISSATKTASKVLEFSQSLKTTDGFVEKLKIWGASHKIASGQVMMALRIVLVGQLKGIDLQEIISFLGLESVAERASMFCEKNI